MKVKWNMNTTNLPEKASLVLDFICGYQDSHGFAPTVAEIMSGLDMRSVRGVVLQLEKLENFGYIQRVKNSPRAIQVLSRPNAKSETIRLPLVGDIQAGTPALAEENIDGYFDVPLAALHGRRNGFLLKVKGNSMNKAGYNPGDLVIVVEQLSPTHGDIVVAYDEQTNSATLKRFKKLNGFTFLWPESYDPTHKPLAGESFLIQGKVVSKLSNK